MATISLGNEKNLMLGIDFGTTNTVVSFYNDDTSCVEIIPIDGNSIFPTAVNFQSDEIDDSLLKFIFGKNAVDGAIIYPESTILSIKSMLSSDTNIVINVDGKEYFFTPVEVVSIILENIRNKANEYIQTELFIDGHFSKVVITVPAKSTDKHKKLTKEACVLAGFSENDIHIRLEPIAAAIIYAKTKVTRSSVLVYDFGGGTFDSCILDIDIDDKKPVVSIKSTSGDNNLGGNDIDKILLDIIYLEFLKLSDNKIDLFDNDESILSITQKKIAIARLMQTSTKTKERLSKSKSCKVRITPLIQDPFIINIDMVITEEDFLNHKRVNRLNDSDEVFSKFVSKSVMDIINLTLENVKESLNSANMNPSDIDEIFLVGGSCLMPIVSEKVTDFFDKSPFRGKLNPALSISEGASYYGKIIEDPDNSILKSIETTIHSLGIEISGRRYLEIIKPNTKIPENGLVVSAENILTTRDDNITKMVIVVYEYTKNSNKNVISVRENGMKRLCGTTLTGIPKNVKGAEKVSIIFTVSKDNILNVTAKSTNGDVSTNLVVDELY